MINLFRFLKGFVTIMVSGDCNENFINLCTKNGVSVWNIDRFRENLYINIFACDYHKIPKLRRLNKSKLKIKVNKKQGLPFIIRRYLSRPGLFVGFVLFLAINIFLSQFIWIIGVEGNEKIETEKIVEACSDLGINIGDKKDKIDTYNSKNELAIMFDDIAWASINVEGSRLTVNISEASNSKKEENIFARNIIASRDGVIKKIEVTSGVKNVVVNQAVRKGDLLVSGVVENLYQIRFVSATGKIIAETNRQQTLKLNKEMKIKNTHTYEDKRSVIKFFWLEIPTYLSGVNYSYEAKTLKNYLTLFGQELPIGLLTKNYKQIVEEKISLSKNDAQNICLMRFSDSLRNSGVESVISYDALVEETEKSYVVTIKAICLENICDYKIIMTN